MEKISYFRLQAKNLMRDFKTQKFDPEGLSFYVPKFFDDIDDIILYFNIDEQSFTLMNAQHRIANLAGFKNWSDLIHASDEALELGKLLLDNRKKETIYPLVADWEMYIGQNKKLFDSISDESKLEIFKAVYREYI